MAEKNYKKPLIYVSVIATILIIILWLSMSSLNSSLEYYREELYGYNTLKCEGDKQGVCIGEDETYALCDTDRFEYGVCLKEEYDWIQCKDKKEYAVCIGEGEYVGIN